MVYYYDPTQIPAVSTYPQYPQQTPAYALPSSGMMHQMGGMMTPSPDGFYYPQATQGAVYYGQ